MDDLVEKVESSAQSKNEMYRLEVTVSKVRGHLKETHTYYVIAQRNIYMYNQTGTILGSTSIQCTIQYTVHCSVRCMYHLCNTHYLYKANLVLCKFLTTAYLTLSLLFLEVALHGIIVCWSLAWRYMC